ncbi:MAG: hypothetical protein ACRCU5_02910 [Rhizobiaceae bacterium]
MSNGFDTGPLATLRKIGSRFELAYPDYDLVIRGPYIEWVLEAAAEIIARTERLRADGAVEEMQMLAEFNGETDDMDIEAEKFERQARFDTIPQCLVSMGTNDYRWVQVEGRTGPDHAYVERLYDHSLTRKPGNWLADQQS